jgi:HEPN domain-containing protein
LLKLIQDFPEPEARTRLLAHDDDARHLDRMYIPTRYPSGLPDVIPAEAYTAGDARAALGQCRRLLEAVGSLTAGRI